MKDFTSVSALAARIAMHKLYNSSQYASLSQQISAFSKALAKKLKENSEIDSATSALFSSMMYAELKEQRTKKNEHVEQHMSIQTTVFPQCFEIATGKADSIAISIIEALYATESHTLNMLKNSLAEPAAQLINDIVDINCLCGVSMRRAQYFQNAIQAINNDCFWNRTEKTIWTCLQCGTITCSESAFAECECCHAKREYAAG